MKIRPALVALVVVSLCSASLGGGAREWPADETEALAIESLQARAEEIRKAQEELDRRAERFLAAVVARRGLPASTRVRWDPKRTVFVEAVAPVASPVGGK